jgi:hypothetical protein
VVRCIGVLSDISHSRRETAGFRFRGDAERALPDPARSRDYRERVTRLRALAADSPNPQIRAYLLTTAAQFDRLADYAAASVSSASIV